MNRSFIFFALLLCQTMQLFGQTSAPGILLEPLDIPGLKGVQAFAFGQYEGKWLIVGGRLDGLHRRQPFASFHYAGNNDQLVVVDPIQRKTWNAPLTSLSIDLQEQLSATNTQFHQDGKYLYIAGGYGYSGTAGDHITYAKLTAIDVPNTIYAVMNAAAFAPWLRQIADTAFALTGGHLKKIENSYYLIGGQKFMGRYNPMGPDHGPGFIQEYSNQLRKFNIEDDGKNIVISHYQTITDAAAFHRRDYNVVPQVLPNGAEGVTLFSGVFQPTADIPFLNSVTIDGDGYGIDSSFAQYYNHYHCAAMPLYSKFNNEMHNIFFGGIAQYYDSAGVLVQNSDVPFVKTIAQVTRDKAGNLAEFKLPVEMPGFLGAGAEFIPSPSIPHYANGTIKLDSIPAGKTLAGFIFGGISSTAPNIFWVNTGEESHAGSQLFKVYLVTNQNTLVAKLNPQSSNGLQMQVYPDMGESSLIVNFFLTKNEPVELQIAGSNGKIINREILHELTMGKNSTSNRIKNLKAGRTYWVTLKTNGLAATQKINIEP